MLMFLALSLRQGREGQALQRRERKGNEGEAGHRGFSSEKRLGQGKEDVEWVRM